jgi:hypothetical protein
MAGMSGEATQVEQYGTTVADASHSHHARMGVPFMHGSQHRLALLQQFNHHGWNFLGHFTPRIWDGRTNRPTVEEAIMSISPFQSNAEIISHVSVVIA